MKSFRSIITVWPGLLCLIMPSTCFAYVDPSTGGYIFQMLFPIISVITAICIFFRNGIKRLFSVFSKKDSSVDRPDE
jgi:hypothetical protein